MGAEAAAEAPRNRHIAEILQSHGIGTLLFDLLTEDEKEIDRSIIN